MAQLNEDNKIPVLIIGISIFMAVIFVVWFFNNPAYLSFVMGCGLYAFLGVIALGFWTNGQMQDYFLGIEKSPRTFLWIFGGILLGVVFLSLNYFGLSMGTPIMPDSVGTSLRWIITNWFAPIFEDSLCFALFGFVLFLTRKCNSSACSIDRRYIWLAIAITTAFFVVLHFAAYSTGFYEANNLVGGWLGLSAVSGSLIAAGIFRLVTCYFVSLKGVRNYALAIAAHYAVNQWLFVKASVVIMHFLPLIMGR